MFGCKFGGPIRKSWNEILFFLIYLVFLHIHYYWGKKKPTYLDSPNSTEAIRLFNRFSGREENFSGWISARKVTSLKYWTHKVGNWKRNGQIFTLSLSITLCSCTKLHLLRIYLGRVEEIHTVSKSSFISGIIVFSPNRTTSAADTWPSFWGKTSSAEYRKHINNYDTLNSNNKLYIDWPLPDYLKPFKILKMAENKSRDCLDLLK
jgi:hypothetical protein